MSGELAIVLAGGGERAVAWELGVLAGLADAGLDPAAADLVVGTSAGALVGAHVAAGIGPVEAARAVTCAQPTPGEEPSARSESAGLEVDAVPLDDAQEPAGRLESGGPEVDAVPLDGAQVSSARLEPAGPEVDAVPLDGAQELFGAAVGAWLDAAGADVAELRRRVGAVALGSRDDCERFVAGAKRRLPDGGWPARLTLMAIDAETGERVELGAEDGVALERGVAASRAIPGLRPTVGVGHRRLMDGAVGSATNADAALGAARVVVVTPTPPGPAPGTLFELWNAALEEELALLRDAGAEVVLVAAGAADQEAMGADMLSGARARQAFDAGRRSGAAAVRPARGPA